MGADDFVSADLYGDTEPQECQEALYAVNEMGVTPETGSAVSFSGAGESDAGTNVVEVVVFTTSEDEDYPATFSELADRKPRGRRWHRPDRGLLLRTSQTAYRDRANLSRHSREWRNRQTRTVQVRVPERAWGFNSPLAHPVR